MIGIRRDKANAKHLTNPIVQLELSGASSSERFVERARSLIRDAVAAQRDFTLAMGELEVAYSSSVRAIEAESEQRLLALDRQLAAIYDNQRQARALLNRAGFVAASAPVSSNRDRGAHVDFDAPDLAHLVAEAQRQLTSLQSIVECHERSASERSRSADTRPSINRWRVVAPIGGGVTLGLAATIIITRGISMFAVGAAVLGLALVTLSAAFRSVQHVSKPDERPRDLSEVVNEAEARFEFLATKIEAAVADERSRLIRQLLEQKALRSAQHAQRLAQLKPDFIGFRDDTEQVAPRWKADAWRAWQPAKGPAQAVRLGELETLVSLPLIPLLLPFPGERALLIKTTSAGRQRASDALQNVLLRLLATMPPGNLQLTLFDPLGLGQNVAGFLRLADYDDRLISGYVATEATQIEQQLLDLTGHMERVIQENLRNTFTTIHDYNDDAGEIAEPYRLLAIFDFPENFSETAARRLLSIMQNGPRCGVFTAMVIDQTKPLPYSFDLSEIEASSLVISSTDGRFVWEEEGFDQCTVELDRPPETRLFHQIVDTIGQEAVATNTSAVPFRRIAPEHERWWRASSAESLSAPLGPIGVRTVQSLDLGRGTAQHALVVGKTGSGKSTLLHTLILSLTLAYSPNEVQLFLIDFKHGVEFKIYAEAQLPHARVIAIESEREFGLSVLQELDSELVRRGDRFRAQGVDNLADYRGQSAEPLPRILLLVDEFQEFFTEDDQISNEAAQLLDRLVRQGRAFGLHVVLVTQTLAGSYSLARGTIDQMAVRIALQCTDADSRLILADDNPASRLLSRPGEAIYNATNGLSEGNRLFQVAWLPADEQLRYLRQLRQFAAATNHRPVVPTIVFEGNAPVSVLNNRPLTKLLDQPSPPTSNERHVWLGEPIKIGEPVVATFRRRSGSNLLIVGQNADSASAMLSIALVSLAVQTPCSDSERPALNLLDFGTPDASQADIFTQLETIAQLPLRVGRRPQASEWIGEIADEVERRLKTNAANQPSLFLIIRGLHRARDLHPVDGFRISSFDVESPTPTLAEQFETILLDGPEVGVHTIVWCDTMTILSRSIERRALHSFSLRVAFQMSADDSVNLIDTTIASKLGPRRAILFDEYAGRIEKFRPYAQPPRQWFERAGQRRA